uniref:Uncharacterized protein n=1 Tax=Arundo donax TaxID=35708 RepID=A0A0A9E4A4_ARUDO
MTSNRSQMAVAPARTPPEIFLFLHRTRSAGLPPPRTEWTGLSRPKRR